MDYPVVLKHINPVEQQQRKLQPQQSDQDAQPLDSDHQLVLQPVIAVLYVETPFNPTAFLFV